MQEIQNTLLLAKDGNNEALAEAYNYLKNPDLLFTFFELYENTKIQYIKTQSIIIIKRFLEKGQTNYLPAYNTIKAKLLSYLQALFPSKDRPARFLLLRIREARSRPLPAPDLQLPPEALLSKVISFRP